jgi:putative glutamine amidotransferase
MRCATILALFIALFGISPLHAEVVGLQVWQSEPDGPRLVIPVRKDEVPRSWVESYLQAFSADPDYRPLNGGQDLKLGDAVRDIKAFAPSAQELPFVVLANRPGHMQGSDPFLKSVLSSLDRAGAAPYVLPLGLETVLTKKELAEFHARVVEAFPGMLAIGGGDIDPALYGQAVAGARDIVPARDRVEASLIERYTRSERGAFYGICRGSQLCAASLGLKLEQDLPTSRPHSSVSHAAGIDGARDAAHISEWHPIEISEDSRFLLPAVGRKQISVNSRHHQAVIEQDHSALRVVARARDGTVEALEFRNGRGALFQFHPEDMGTEEAARILDAMVSTARQHERARVGDCLRGVVLGLD